MDTTRPLRLVRLGEVAELFEREPVTIQRWVAKGAFLPPRLDGGNQPYWLADELEDYLRRPPAVERDDQAVAVDQPIVTSHRQVRR